MNLKMFLVRLRYFEKKIFECFHQIYHCVKSVHIRLFSATHFPAFRLNTDMQISVSNPNAGKRGPGKRRI